MRRKSVFLFIGMVLSPILIYYMIETLRTTPIRRTEVVNPIIIPPELFGGDTISIGDSYDRINKVSPLTHYWHFEMLLGRNIIDEKLPYRGFALIAEAEFNTSDQLVGLSFPIENKDSLPPEELFDNTMNILKKYYGKDYVLFLNNKDTTNFLVQWNAHNDMEVLLEYNGHPGEYSSGFWVYYNKMYDFSLDDYHKVEYIPTL